MLVENVPIINVQFMSMSIYTERKRQVGISASNKNKDML